eukprot:CAMPEP_0167774668 /NCGR_PEP_ID=MMETSP0111_2-20121227/2129_1 /TAXON_ID=91324 /ORGANISM="Lotharella globosa, Strain CCCM811" /LENGTH=113 /DNA_ID=CAMNT_0007664493 /DNA_START=216 /DNA_END=557 /DNA_ORIENTATION=-
MNRAGDIHQANVMVAHQPDHLQGVRVLSGIIENAHYVGEELPRVQRRIQRNARLQLLVVFHRGSSTERVLRIGRNHHFFPFYRSMDIAFQDELEFAIEDLKHLVLAQMSVVRR